MGEKIAFENGRISDFQGLATLALDRVILHTVMHHSSTSTYMPNFMGIKETFCGWTDVWTGGRTFYTHCIRSTRGVDLKMHIFLLIKCVALVLHESLSELKGGYSLSTEQPANSQ